jgi:hypothetical protein
MESPSAEALLDAWEQGLGRPPLQQALMLLAAAPSDTPADILPQLSIGQRDSQLLALREQLFGPYLDSSAVCPACGQRIEWRNTVADFVERAGDVDNKVGAIYTLDCHGYQLQFRLPDSRDIVLAVTDIQASDDGDAAQRMLLSRCLVTASNNGEPCAVTQLPEAVLQTLAETLEQLDPLAEIRIGLECTECAHSWEILFDIASFLCAEVDDWAQHMLRSVSRLAAAYGWSESEILGLSPLRRQLYLGMQER